ncbi:MAG: EamA family transporter [Clostridiaceae bacterium]|nr:EamA family transporter [Clostridiaceae bacterium]
MEKQKEVKNVNWNVLAPGFIVLAGITWGLVGLFSHDLREAGLTPLQITHWRNLVAGISIFIFILIKDKSLLKIDPRDFWIFFGTGVLSIAFFNICYLTCMQESSISVAVTLLHTSPVFLMLFSVIIFKEKFTASKAFAMILAGTGLLFITGFIGAEAVPITTRALVYGVLSGFGYSLYSVFGRFALRKYNWLTILVYTFIFAIVALFPFADFPRMIEVTFREVRVVTSMLALGLVSTLLSFVFYTIGLKHMDISEAALLTFVEPTVGMLVSVLLFDEYFTINYAIGMTLVISSIVVLNRTMHRVTLEEEPE